LKIIANLGMTWVFAAGVPRDEEYEDESCRNKDRGLPFRLPSSNLVMEITEQTRNTETKHQPSFEVNLLPQSEDQFQRELHFSRVEGTRDHSEIRRSENPARQSEVRMHPMSSRLDSAQHAQG
jgi:hypothetical protein